MSTILLCSKTYFSMCFLYGTCDDQELKMYCRCKHVRLLGGPGGPFCCYLLHLGTSPITVWRIVSEAFLSSMCARQWQTIFLLSIFKKSGAQVVSKVLATAFERYLRRMSGALNFRVRAPKGFRDPYTYIYMYIYTYILYIACTYVYI